VLVLLSVKAGLRAGEIANLTWPMVVDPADEVGRSMELQELVDTIDRRQWDSWQQRY
jgi:integrase/recombinase XerD